MITLDQVKRGLEAIPTSVREYGLRGGLRRWTGLAYHRARGDVEGRSVFSEEWDLCVVLDACRADELRAQRDRFDWLGPVDQFPSLGSATWEWLPRTLDRTPAETLGETAYVCANPHTAEFCSADQFHALDEVWRYAWDERRGTVLPRPVTERAIHHGRSADADRLLVHYLQPHVPFLVEDAKDQSMATFRYGDRSGHDDWDRVTRGDLPRDRAIAWYRETLARVLEDVELLLSNVDAERVVITADHGEAFGEWGIYGHPANVDLACLTRVPWVETSASDAGEHEPDEYAVSATEGSVSERLGALGYRDRDGG